MVNYSVEEQKILAWFGDNLRRLRLERGLSQEALAEKADINRNYVSDVERGRRNISILNIVALSKALGVDPKELVK